MLMLVVAARPQHSPSQLSQNAGQRLLTSSADHLCAGPDPVSAPQGMLASHRPASSALGKLCKAECVKRRQSSGRASPGSRLIRKGISAPNLC